MIKQGSVIGIGGNSAKSWAIRLAVASVCGIAASVPTFGATSAPSHRTVKAKTPADQASTKPAPAVSTNNETYAAYTRYQMMAATPKYYGLPTSDAQRKFR